MTSRLFALLFAAFLITPVQAEETQQKIDGFWEGYQQLLEFQAENPEIMMELPPQDLDRVIARYLENEDRLQEWEGCLLSENQTVLTCLDQFEERQDAIPFQILPTN